METTDRELQVGGLGVGGCRLVQIGDAYPPEV